MNLDEAAAKRYPHRDVFLEGAAYLSEERSRIPLREAFTEGAKWHAEAHTQQGEPSDAQVEAGAEAILRWHHPRQKLADYPTDVQEGLREQSRAALCAAWSTP